MEDIEPSIRELLNQGSELSQTANAAQAESIIQSALEMAESKLPAGHPIIALCLNELGEWHRKEGRFAEAEPLLRRALEIDEAALGRDDAETAIVVNNLALVLRRTDRLEEAEKLFRRALVTLETKYGESDVRLAGVLNNLAQVLQHTNRSDKAEPLLLRSLQLFLRELGPDHPGIAIAMNNLASVLESAGRIPEAERYSRRHVQIFLEYEQKTGNRHAHLGDGINNYFALLLRAGLTREAAEARTRALIAGKREDDLDAATFTSPPDFDRLIKNAYGVTADLHDKEQLFVYLFKAEEWLFIARGELPNVQPYVASNEAFAENKPMLKAFTDSTKLAAAAREWELQDPSGNTQMLSLKVATILPTLAEYEKQGVWGIHFNADRKSESFYVPMPQLASIRERIAPLLA